MTNVVIADDEEFVRYYLRGLIEHMRFNVVSEVDNGEALFEILKETEPDILILDINMPILKGNDFLREYGKTFSKICVIILTISASSVLKTELTNMGYKYFIRKDTPPEALIEQIRFYWNNFLSEKI